MLFLLATQISRENPDPAGSAINWPPRSVSIVWDYGFSKPDSKEIR